MLPVSEWLYLESAVDEALKNIHDNLRSIRRNAKAIFGFESFSFIEF